MSKSNTASIGFEQQIWAAADILRGNMDAAVYKHVVLGIIFLNGDIYKKYNYIVDLEVEYNDLLKVSDTERVRSDQYLRNYDIVYNLTSETIDDLGKSVIVKNEENEPFIAGMETTIMRIDNTGIIYPPFLNYILQT